MTWAGKKSTIRQRVAERSVKALTTLANTAQRSILFSASERVQRLKIMSWKCLLTLIAEIGFGLLRKSHTRGFTVWILFLSKVKRL